MHHIFGKTTATAATIAAEIAKAEGELSTVQSKITATLAGLATFTDEQHVAAETKQAELKRSEARLVARISELRAELTAATVAEAEAARVAAAAAFANRVSAARDAVEAEAPKLLAEYDDLAERVAAVIDKLKSIDAEVAAVNAALRSNGIADSVPNITAAHRQHPDQQAFERREVRPCWVSADPVTGKENIREATLDDRGEPIPQVQNTGFSSRGVPQSRARLENREVVVARGAFRPGAYLHSLESVVLPPGSLNSPWHWPRPKAY